MSFSYKSRDVTVEDPSSNQEEADTKVLLHASLVLDVLANSERETIGCCFHDNREQKKN